MKDHVEASFALHAMRSDRRVSRRNLLFVLALVAFALLTFAPPLQAKVVVDGFGVFVPASIPGTSSSIPPLGGEFSLPAGLAVNNSGAGGVAPGTVYVTDTLSQQNRVQRFSPSGSFERTWGQNVFGRDERQLIRIDSGGKEEEIGGSFTLSFGGDTASFNVTRPCQCSTEILPSASTVQSALQALPSIGPGNIVVTGALSTVGGAGSTGGGAFLVRFTGALGGTNVPQLSFDTSQLTGTPPLSPSISTVENGTGGNFAGFEICTVAASCKNGETTGTTANGGQLNSPQGIAVNQANGHVYVTEGANRRVSEFDADGNFVRAWGWDVQIGGVTTFEICNVAASCKQAAAAGGDGGRFGALTNSYPVTDAANNVWVPDQANRRIQKFDGSGNFLAAYGWDVIPAGKPGDLGVNVFETCTSTTAGDCRAGQTTAPGNQPGQFATGSPSKLAIDSVGNVYAIDAGNNRVLKFNPTFTPPIVPFGGGTFPAFTTSAPSQVISTQGGTRLVFAINNNVTASENQLLELDPADASVKDTSLAGAGLTNIAGLAEVGGSGNLQMTTTSDVSPRRVLTLSSSAPPAPVPVLNPVTTKTDTTATFSGTVDPKGGWVSCAFEYSTDQVDWKSVPEPDCDSLSAGGGTQAVSQSVTGLAPGSHYFVKLSVSRPLAPNSTQSTLAKAFDTDGAAPAVSTVGTTDINDTSVRLLGTIDPRNSTTGYIFEYGTTPSLDLKTAPVNVGGGATPVLVSQIVNGLQPGTVYYFKLVATNLVGSTASSGQSFTTRTEPPSPLSRAYELVSPPDKNFGGVDFTPLFRAATAPTGEAVDFCTASGLPTDPPGQATGACTNYVSRRADSGWHTESINPPACSVFSILGVPSMPTLNLDHALIGVPLQGDFCSIPPLDSGAPSTGAGFALYRESLVSDPFSFDSLGPQGTEVHMVEAGNNPSTSDDASHVVYPSAAQQTPDAPAGSAIKLFDWHEDSLSLVSKDPANQPLTTNSRVPLDSMNGISASGDRIFFQNPVRDGYAVGGSGCIPTDQNCELYMREDASSTHWVSEQECAPACSNTNGNDLFLKASLDGSKAFFRSKAKLVDADAQGGFDLYRFVNSTNPGVDKNLTLMSRDNEPADGNVADVQSVLGASDDGDTVYYIANGQILAGEPTAGGPKIYRWRWNGGSPTTEYLGTLRQGNDAVGGDNHLWLGSEDHPLIRLVTPDGKYLVVQTVVQLDSVVDRDSSRDVYRWGSVEGWICVSCQFPGTASAGRATINGTDLTGITGIAGLGMANQELRIVMSDDGKHIFFTAKDALVQADVNGPMEDVYEWNDGALVMISSGRDNKDAVLLGAASSGRDVFFITYEKMVGWDTDANTDVYDARIGGGFPEPPPPPLICQTSDECRDPSSSPPPTVGAGTPQFQGAGNPRRKQCAKGKIRRHGKCVKKPAKKRARHNQRRAGR